MAVFTLPLNPHPLHSMGLVNQLLQLYEECQATNRDVCLSFELREGVESFLFKNILRPSSPPPSSGGSRRTQCWQCRPREGGTVQPHHLMRGTTQNELPECSLGGVERIHGHRAMRLFPVMAQEQPRPARAGVVAVHQRPHGILSVKTPKSEDLHIYSPFELSFGQD